MFALWISHHLLIGGTNVNIKFENSIRSIDDNDDRIGTYGSSYNDEYFSYSFEELLNDLCDGISSQPGIGTRNFAFLIQDPNI